MAKCGPDHDTSDTMNTDVPTETSVLVVGGGPTGLSAAVELDRRGVDCVVVEPRETVSHMQPRAKTTTVRTMEHFRRWGVADRIREAANLPVEWSQDAVFCTTLLGPAITRIHDVHGLVPEGSDEFAESGQQIPQYLVEETLRERVREGQHASLVTGWRLVSLEQDDRGVRGTITDDEARREVGADYLVGSDGAKSTVREQIGSEYQGERNPRSNLGVVFRAPDLADRHGHGPAVHYWILNGAVQGLLGRLDLDDRWWMIAVNVEDPESPDPSELLYRMVGERIDAEVEATDPWSAYMLLVDEVRVGRAFLAGDAAHLNPPWGGQGYNTGVADAVNLSWKLAAVLNGWGGQALLDSYEAERRPVWEWVMEETTKNMKVSPADLVVPDVDAPGERGEAAREDAAEMILEAKDSEFHNLGMVLGYRYEDSPVLPEDDGTLPPKDVVEYRQTSHPGARLPHVWLDDGDSVYDALGPVLSLVQVDAAADAAPLLAAADRAGISLELVDVSGRDLRDRYEAGLVLVRPDQHVAWRGDDAPSDPDALLELVTCRAGSSG